MSWFGSSDLAEVFRLRELLAEADEELRWIDTLRSDLRKALRHHKRKRALRLAAQLVGLSRASDPAYPWRESSSAGSSRS